MRNKLFSFFSSNIKIRVSGKNVNNFIKKLIINKINIVKVIPISYKEIDLVIDYNDLDKIVKYKSIYNIDIKNYYGKLKVLKIIKKNIFILVSIIISLITIYILSNVIFNVEVIHSNSNIIKLLNEELDYYGIKKYSFVKNYDDIEKIEEKILENNKDKIEWLEIIRKGTKYIVRVEERIINRNNDDNKIYDIVASKNAVIKRINFESGEKVKNIDTFVRKGDVIISSYITLPNNEKVATNVKGSVLGEVWYNVNIEFPYHYFEEKYTGKKRNVLVFNIINRQLPLFNFKKYKSFNRDFKYIFSNLLIPVNLNIEYQYETNVIDKKYNYEEAKEAAINLSKEKLKKKYPSIIDLSKVIILYEEDNGDKINLNLFIGSIEDITEYREVVEDSSY